MIAELSGCRQPAVTCAVARDRRVAGGDIDARARRRRRLAQGGALGTRAKSLSCSSGFPRFELSKGCSCKFASPPMLPNDADAGALVVPVFSDDRLDGRRRGGRRRARRRHRRRSRLRRDHGRRTRSALVHAKHSAVPPRRCRRSRRPREVRRPARSPATPEPRSATSGSATSRARDRASRRRRQRPAAAPHRRSSRARSSRRSTPRSIAPSPSARSITDEVAILAGTPSIAPAFATGARAAQILGEALNSRAPLALTPGNDMTPTILADTRAARSAPKPGWQVDVLDEARCAPSGMGSLLGVSRGSEEPAKLIVMTYDGDPSSSERLALVGKGLTFDSGGISIKPAERHGRDEVRHVRRRRRDRRDVRDRQAQAEAQRGRRDRRPARTCPGRAAIEAGRHRARHERQDDRGHQHRRRRAG